MSDPEMLEEWALKNNCYEEFFGKPAKTSHLYKSVMENTSNFSDVSYVKEALKTSCGGKVEYDIDYEGNLREVVVKYNVNGKRYEVSLSIHGYPEDHIRLEVRRKYKNPLKNVFDQNLLASSVTPIHIRAYTSGCMWKAIREDKIKYPSDTRYTYFAKAALSDIKYMSCEIEEKKEYMAHYKERLHEEQVRREREALEEQDRREQSRLKKKKSEKELEIINFLVNGKKR